MVGGLLFMGDVKLLPRSEFAQLIHKCQFRRVFVSSSLCFYHVKQEGEAYTCPSLCKDYNCPLIEPEEIKPLQRCPSVIQSSLRGCEDVSQVIIKEIRERIIKYGK